MSIRLLKMFDHHWQERKLWQCREGLAAHENRAETRRTLTLIWGTTAQPNQALETEAWYHLLLKASDAIVRPVLP